METLTDPPAKRDDCGENLQILIVEDHEDTIVYLSRYLEDNGHTVRIARNAEEALTALRSQQPDLLLCDIILPDRDGWDLMKDLTDVRPARCVSMSVRGKTADIDRSALVGFDHHLTKPFLPEELDAVIGKTGRSIRPDFLSAANRG